MEPVVPRMILWMEVSTVLKDFIINNIAEDDRAIRREVRNQYNEISV